MQRMTLLEAINTMLLDIRMAPLASLADLDAYHEATMASNALVAKTREVLARGWNFNTNRTSLSPDAITGKIQVPGFANVIDAWASEGDPGVYMQATGYLRNMDDDSEVFTSSVTVNIVKGLSFVDLPSPIQGLCLIEARVHFSSVMRPGETIGQTLGAELGNAMALAKGWDARQKRRTMLDNMLNRVHVNRNFPRRY